ncbi:PAS domain S-box protein [Capilliphycus salinus ALCB114379]|uniref:PAS domain S-box protein n=1 Tax=Capilliphycus salinus TaxID=2768948 RepID=UPI0039A76C97
MKFRFLMRPFQKKGRKTIPLWWALVVPFVLQTVGAVTLVGYLSYRTGRQAVENLADQLMKNTGQQVNQELDRYLQKAHEFNQLQIAAIASGAIDLQNLDRLHRYLILQHQQTEDLTTLLFGNPQGDFRISHRVSPTDYGVNTYLKPEELPYEASFSQPSNPSTLKIYSINQAGDLMRYLEKITNIDVRDREWYRRAVETGKPGWTSPFQIGSTDHLALNAYAPLYDKSQQLLGVFAVNISLNQLGDFLRRLEVGKSGEVYIIERNGLLIADSTSETPYSASGEIQIKSIGRPGMVEFRRRDPSEISNRAIQDSYKYLVEKFENLAGVKSAQALNFHRDGDRYFLNISPYQDEYGLDWLIITVIPESDFMAEIHRNTRTTVLLCLLTLGLAIAAGLGIAHRFTFRIARLNRVSQELASGNLTQRLPADSPVAEVKGLALSFNQMADRLEESFHRLQNALQESEEKFTTVFRTIPDPIAITNRTEGRFLEVNNRMIEFYGYSRSQIIGRTASEVGLWVNCEERGQFRHLLETQGYVDNLEVTTPTSWGEIKIVLLSATVCNLQGQDAVIVVIRDISDRKQMEEQLRKTEQWLQQYSRQSPSSIYTLVLEPDGRLWYEYVSSAVETIHELTPAQALENANLVIDQIHPDDRPGYLAARTRSAESLELFSHEWRIVTPTGQLKWLQATSKPERRRNGAIAWHGVIQDISDRIQTQEALRQNQERFQQLAAASPGVIYTVIEYPTGPVCYEYVSQAFEDIHEISVAEVRQDASITFNQIHPDDRVGYQQAVKESIETGKPFKHEWRIITPSGTMKWIQANSRAEKRKNGEMAWHGVVLEISDRKRAEIALQKALQELTYHVENSPLGTIRWDREFRVQTWSKQAEKIFGWTAEEVIGKKMDDWQFIFEEDWDDVHQVTAQLLEGVSRVSHNRNYHKDGSIVYCEWYNSILLDERGDIVSVLSLVQDVSDRFAAEQALQAKTEELDRFFSVALDLLCIADTNGYFHRLNQQWEKTLGYSLQELENSRFLDWVHPEDLESTLNEIQVLANQNISINFVNRYRCQDGSYRWIEWRSFPVGTLIYGAARDITERKQLELTLQESEAKTRYILNSAIAAISSLRVFKDSTWQIEQVSAGVEFLSGYTADELISDNDLWTSRIVPEDWEAIQAQIFADIFAEKSGTYEYRLHHKDGSLRWISQTNNSCWDPMQRCWNVTVISVDITDRKQAQLELQQAKEAAETANQSKSAFLANMSHELRTPLNAILGFTQLMNRDTTLNPDYQKYIKIIHNSGSYLLKLINEILDLSKIEAGKLTLENQPINLFDLLESLHATFSQRVKNQDLEVYLEIFPQVPQYIIVDSQKLQQVLINLIGNAIKFTQSGKVTWRVCFNVRDSPQSDVISLNFEVEDTGSGISSLEMNQIFEAFSQASAGRKAQEGTGLGLTISRRLVNLMGGEITVNSEVGKGSTFAFSIPVQITTKSSVQPQQPKQKIIGLAPNQRVYRILVVDDQVENRLLLVKLLEEVGLEVKEAASGEQALFVWQNWHPHLIWMDVRMPGMDGYETTKQIRAQEQNRQSKINSPQSTVIIALTAQASRNEQTQAFAAGCNDYISKPFEIETLFEKMSEHLGIVYISSQDNHQFPNDKAFGVEPNLTVENLAVMPQNWVVKLYQASITCQHTTVEKLIKQIPPEYSSLAVSLQHLTENFEFEKMMKLTQMYLDTLSERENNAFR